MGAGPVSGLSNTFFKTSIMKHLELQGKKRITGKKADVKNVRNEQRVPCVIYGAGVENTSFSVDEKELKKTISANRFGQPEEVAALVGFLASPEAGYITGNVISINGGLYT